MGGQAFKLRVRVTVGLSPSKKVMGTVIRVIRAVIRCKKWVIPVI